MNQNTGHTQAPFNPLALRIGNAIIDDEHAALFRSLEKLLAIARSQPIEASEEFSEVFSQIGRQLSQHFCHEEAMFKSSGMPEEDVADHVRAHSQIMEQFSKLNFDLMQGTKIENAGFALMVQQWIVNHLVHYDLKLRPFIADSSADGLANSP